MSQFESGKGLPPVNHAQEARATINVTHDRRGAATVWIGETSGIRPASLP
jgi:hypothetical protein